MVVILDVFSFVVISAGIGLLVLTVVVASTRAVLLVVSSAGVRLVELGSSFELAVPVLVPVSLALALGVVVSSEPLLLREVWVVCSSLSEGLKVLVRSPHFLLIGSLVLISEFSLVSTGYFAS